MEPKVEEPKKEESAPVTETPKEEPKEESKEEPKVEEPKKEEPKPAAAAAPAVESTKVDADALVKEQEAEIDEEVVSDLFGAGDSKDHLSIIFMGHVDAGKSTMGGNLLYLTGAVDKRTVEKYERDAKDAGRQGWYLSWIMDTNREERDQGKTVEVGRSYFETEKRRYTILDAPGHKMYVPSMIGGASQADVGILVISARKGEYETGFERGGQTREHAILAKTQHLFAGSANKAEAWQELIDHEDVIRSIAQEVVWEAGQEHPVEIRLGRYDFPERSYGSLTVPAGDYHAVQVVIGAGRGQY